MYTGTACGKKFNCYSFSGSDSMYTACGCGLRVRVVVVFGQQQRTFLLKIVKVIWYQNLRLIKLDAMVKKILKSDQKQGNYSHLKKSYYLC